MSDELIAAQLLKAVEDCKKGLITREELRGQFLQAADTLEVEQWQIIQNLRTKAPEDQRDLAQDVAKLLERELRKGSGTA